MGTAHGRLPSGVQVLTATPASRWTWRELLLECGRPSWGGGRSWVARWLSSQQTPVQPLGTLQRPQGARPACGSQLSPGAAPPHVCHLLA